MQGRLKILYIWDADYPWDVRVEKICTALEKDGHELHIAARNLKQAPIKEEVHGATVHRIRAWKNKKLNYILSFPLFASPVWKGFLDKIIQEEGIQLIIVRDLPMTIAGIWAGKRHNIPVIMDMAEDYVAMVRDIWRARKFQGLNLLVRNPYLAKLVEIYSFKKVDYIIAVTEEAKTVVNGVTGASSVTIVSNTPDVALFSNLECDEVESLNDIKRNYSAIYTGGIQNGRGLQTVIEAIPQIKRKIPSFKFVVVGSGYAKERLKMLSKEIGVEKDIVWVGWVDHEDIYRYIAACRIGVIPHLVTDHVNTTIPNKIFDYMGSGIPIIASNAAPLKRIVETEHCGQIFVSGDSDSLANAVIKVFNEGQNYGENGKNAVFEKYNWNIDQARLLSLVHDSSKAD